MKTSGRNPGGFFLNVFNNIVLNNHMKKLLLPLLLFTQPALSAEEALVKCRQVEEIAERVVCYDNIVDTRFPAEPPEVTRAEVVPDAQSLFGTTDAEAKRIVEATLAIEELDEIEATVTDVRKSANNKLMVTLNNGQIWHQLDNQRMPLKSGEAVIVRKASLSSFRMEKQSGSRRIRVRRAN